MALDPRASSNGSGSGLGGVHDGADREFIKTSHNIIVSGKYNKLILALHGSVLDEKFLLEFQP